MRLKRIFNRIVAGTVAALPLTAAAALPPEHLAAVDCPSMQADSACHITIAPGLGIRAPRRSVFVHEDGLGFDLVGDLAIPTGQDPIDLLESDLTLRVEPGSGDVESLVGVVRMPMPDSGFLGPVDVTERPLASMGFSDGAALVSMEGPISKAPLAKDRDYFFFNAVARFAAELPPISMQTPGGAGVVVLDPTDPFFYSAGEAEGFGGDGKEKKEKDSGNESGQSGDGATDAAGGTNGTPSDGSGSDADSSSTTPTGDTENDGTPQGEQEAKDPEAEEEEGDGAVGMAGFAFSIGGHIPFEPIQTRGVEDRMPEFDGHFFLRTSTQLAPLPLTATGEFIFDLDPAEDGDTPFTPVDFAMSPDLAYGINGSLGVGVPFLRFFEFGFPLGDASAAIVVDGESTRAAFSGVVTADEFLPDLPLPLRPTGGIEVYGYLAANDLVHSYIHAEGSMGIDASGLGALSGVPLGELYSTTAILDVNATGLTIQGTTSVGIHPSVKLAGESGFEVFISPDGESRLTIFGRFIIGDQVLEDARFTVDRNGVRISGRFLTPGYAFAMEGELGPDGYLLLGSVELADPIELNAQASLEALNAVLGQREVVVALEAAVDAGRVGLTGALASVNAAQAAVNTAQSAVNSIQGKINYQSGRMSANYSAYRSWKRKSCKWYDAKCKSKRAYYSSLYYGRYTYHKGLRAGLYGSKKVADAALATARSPLAALNSNLSSARALVAVAEAELANGIEALREAEAVLASYPPIDGSVRMIATIGIDNGGAYGSVEGDWNGQPLTEGYVNLGDPGEACLVVPGVGPLCSSL